MNVFGVGAWELVAILLIMLVFAGPKRMIHWSYVLGQHVAKFRKIWSETVDLVQKEFDEAGVDIKLPKEPPTRKNLNRSLTDAVKPMTQPVQDSLNEVKQDVETFKDVSDALNENKTEPKTKVGESKATAPTRKVKRPPKPTAPKPRAPSAPPVPAEPVSLGAWSGAAQPTTSPPANGSAVNLGTWSGAEVGD